MRIIVVGGSKGIGEALVSHLTGEGHHVEAISRKTEPVAVDLAAPESEIADAMRATAERLGEVDALVVSAGEGAYLSPWNDSIAARERLMRVNFHGPVACYRALHKELRRREGRVLFLGSTVARKGARGLAAYAATKAALEGYVRSEARSLARSGVAMNVLAPGWVETPMTADIKRDIRAAIIRSIPLRRMLSPAEVAEFAAAILEQPVALTGTVLDIAGGA